MPEAITYECPICSEHVEVEAARLDEPINCAACGRSFRAELPTGRPVDDVAPATTDTGPTDDLENVGSEQTLFEAHPAIWRAHPLRGVGIAIGAVLGAAAIGMGLLGYAVAGATGMTLTIAGLVVLAVVGAYVGYLYLQARATTLTITNRRTIITTGLISQATNEVQHDDVRNIRCNQNLLERLLDYGDLELSSSGQDDMELVIDDIPHPKQALEIIRRYQ